MAGVRAQLRVAMSEHAAPLAPGVFDGRPGWPSLVRPGDIVAGGRSKTPVHGMRPSFRAGLLVMLLGFHTASPGHV
jgi:hypothetical protein